jgi:hypothetical protein
LCPFCNYKRRLCNATVVVPCVIHIFILYHYFFLIDIMILDISLLFWLTDFMILEYWIAFSYSFLVASSNVHVLCLFSFLFLIQFLFPVQSRGSLYFDPFAWSCRKEYDILIKSKKTHSQISCFCWTWFWFFLHIQVAQLYLYSFQKYLLLCIIAIQISLCSIFQSFPWCSNFSYTLLDCYLIFSYIFLMERVMRNVVMVIMPMHSLCICFLGKIHII